MVVGTVGSASAAGSLMRVTSQPVTIQSPSLKSLFLELVSEGKVVATGTAFVYSVDGRPFLITARHCLTGKRANGEFISKTVKWQPSRMRLHLRTNNGTTLVHEAPLANESFDPTWVEHPIHLSRYDLAAVPFPGAAQRSDLPTPWSEADVPSKLMVTDEVNIVGYPFGLRAGENLPIWAKGTIATEPALDYDGLPTLLVDSRTRTGQSGSPVIQFFRPGQMVPEADGGMAAYTGPVTRLVGVYTGRVNEQSDLGFVWRMSAIDEICRAVP